eukprot:CAMPEP_0184660670 /NCGR_PEP_ID=MMETSP0308-20130426/34685_1 /TAXON_ID=38269 /ORGANISM="Gloeochaete witrockiana, Strain SAG 46.84" /LENGTH=517 /DNA_ID=CAMNT_0027101399 /DNA_START=246 /DNA_END=1799 /DNA_ORIENTATION=-
MLRQGSTCKADEETPLLQQRREWASLQSRVFTCQCRDEKSEKPATSQGLSLKVIPDSIESVSSDPGGKYTFIVLSILSIMICYADRSNFSVAIIPMGQEYGWDKGTQGLALGAFFYGYVLTQVPGGWLSGKFGGKKVLAAGVSIWSLFTILTAEAARMGVAPLLACRILMGLGEGVAFPSIHAMIPRWVPLAERSTAVAAVTAASYVGTVLAMSISPFLIDNFDWPAVFYSFGLAGLLWVPLWLWKASDSPDRESPREEDTTAEHVVPNPELIITPTYDFSEAEKALSSEESRDSVGCSTPSGSTTVIDQPLDRPLWRKLASSKEVWAICINQYCQSWGFYVLLNWLPTYFYDVFKVDVANLAAFTLLPYAVQGGVGLASGVVADALIAKGMTVLSVRRLMQIVGMLGPATFMLVAAYASRTAEEGTIYITCALALSSLTLAGVSVNHLDIAPRHAGIVFGLGNTTGQMAGLVAVPLAGYLLEATHSWPLIFALGAGHYALGAVVWYAWAGSEVVID